MLLDQMLLARRRSSAIAGDFLVTSIWAKPGQREAKIDTSQASRWQDQSQYTPLTCFACGCGLQPIVEV